MDRLSPVLFTIIAALAMVVSVLRSDWMMLATGAFSILVIFIYHSKGFAIPYRSSILVTALFMIYFVSSAIALTVGSPDASVRGISYVWIFELLIMFTIVFFIGFFFALILDRCTPTKMSFRWLLALAIVITMAFSAAYLFALGFDLWYNDRPFGYDDINTYGWEINIILMVPSVCALFLSLFLSAAGRIFLKNWTKESLLLEV